MERYTSKIHFQRLEETTDAVKQFIEKSQHLLPYKEIIENDYTWNKRIKNERSKFLRPLIVRNVLDMLYSGTLKWHDYVDIVASTEIFNISTYQADEVFDMNIKGKSEEFLEVHKDSSISQYISSYLTYTVGLELIHNSRLSSDIKLQFLNLMTNAGKKVYEGQYIDAFVLGRNHKRDPLMYDEKKFLKKYLERCNCLDGYQLAMCFCYGLVDNGSDFIDKEKWKRLFSSLWVIGINFGICLQILNDMADLSYLNKKSFFEDVFNSKVSYPLYLLWHSSDKAKKLIDVVWIDRHLADVDTFRQELSRIIFDNSTIVNKLIALLMTHYRTISLEILKIKNEGIRDIYFLDFIFPHIFLSRILKTYTRSSKDLNRLIMTDSHITA